MKKYLKQDGKYYTISQEVKEIDEVKKINDQLIFLKKRHDEEINRIETKYQEQINELKQNSIELNNLELT